MILATDLDSKELSRNPTRCKEAYDWLMEDVYGTFGADSDTTRFVYDNNYFSTNSIGHQIGERNTDWDIVTVNATDAEGNPTAAWITPAKIQQWKKAGPRAYMRNYMNTPIEEGNVFRAEWIKYKKLPKLTTYQKLVAYFDPSLSEKTTADFKAIRLWGSLGEELHCIRSFCRQCSIMEAVRWMYDLHDWVGGQGAVAEFWIEGQFWNDPFDEAVRAEGQRRGCRLPLRRDDRKKPNKQTRIESMTGLYEQGVVWHNEAMRNDPDTRAAEGQLLGFGPGSRAHDDAPDADEGAWQKLLRGAAALRAGFSQGREREPEHY
jgi:predicted phage terminase large subunit-like protein